MVDLSICYVNVYHRLPEGMAQNDIRIYRGLLRWLLALGRSIGKTAPFFVGFQNEEYREYMIPWFSHGTSNC